VREVATKRMYVLPRHEEFVHFYLRDFGPVTAESCPFPVLAHVPSFVANHVLNFVPVHLPNNTVLWNRDFPELLQTNSFLPSFQHAARTFSLTIHSAKENCTAGTTENIYYAHRSTTVCRLGLDLLKCSFRSFRVIATIGLSCLDRLQDGRGLPGRQDQAHAVNSF
jgi:hypothetical protein